MEMNVQASTKWTKPLIKSYGAKREGSVTIRAPRVIIEAFLVRFRHLHFLLPHPCICFFGIVSSRSRSVDESFAYTSEGQLR